MAHVTSFSTGKTQQNNWLKPATKERGNEILNSYTHYLQLKRKQKSTLLILKLPFFLYLGAKTVKIYGLLIVASFEFNNVTTYAEFPVTMDTSSIFFQAVSIVA